MRVTVDVIGGKWKPLILFHLKSGTRRFNELERLIPEITHRMLTQQLRELERDEIVVRTVYPGSPRKVEYSFSRHGRTLSAVLAAMAAWGAKHRSRYEDRAASA